MKKLMAIIVVLAFLVAPLAAFAEDEMVIMEEGKLPYELNTWMVRTICANGYVFFVSYVLARQSGAGIHAIQVMEEKNGVSVPMKCDAKKYKKIPAVQPPAAAAPATGTSN